MVKNHVLSIKAKPLVYALAFLFLLGAQFGMNAVNAAAEASPWPMFHQNTALTSTTTGPTPKSPELLWSFKAGSYIFGAPSIANGRAYFGAFDNKVYAVDLSTGMKVWEYPTYEYVWSSPCVSGGIVYVTSLHNVTALVESTGALRWRYYSRYQILSSPIVYNNMVYVCVDGSGIVALNAASGVQAWQYPVQMRITSTPAVAFDKVFMTTDAGFIYALTLQGVRVWEGTMASPTAVGDIVAASPAASDNKVFVSGLYANKIYAFDQASGKEIWEYPTTLSVITCSPTVGYGKVFFATNGVYALNQSTGKELWRFAFKDDTTYASVALSGETVFAVTTRGRLYALHQSNGTSLWETTVASGQWGWTQPVIGDSKLLVAFADTLYAYGSHRVEFQNLQLPAKFESGDSVKINVTVANTGDFNENLSVSLSYNPLIGTQAVSLGPGISKTITYTWNTTGVTPGNYSLTLSATGTSGTGVKTESQLGVSIGVTKKTSAISILSSKNSVTSGETVTISGSLSPAVSGTTITISRRPSGGSWSTLSSVSATPTGAFQYVWTTSDTGTYEIKATWPGDAYTSSSESATQSIVVAAAPFPMTLVLAAVGAIGAVAVVAVMFLRKRPAKPKPPTLQISADPIELPADGKSTSRITLGLFNEEGKPSVAEQDTEVSLSCTEGRLPASLRIQKGSSSASVVFTASTTIGKVSVTARSRGLNDVRIELTLTEKRRYCMHCGTRMPMDSNVCSKCGRTPPSGVDVKTCANCGEVIPIVAKYCSACGAGQPGA